MRINGTYRALIVAVTYLVLGCTWIVISDQVVFELFDDPIYLQSVQIYKGLVFVILSSLLIFGLQVFLYNRFRIRQAERVINELRRENAVVRQVIDQLPIGVAVNRIDTGEAVIINDHFTNIYGWSLEELTGVDTFFEHVYPDPEYRDIMKKRVTGDMDSGDAKRMIWDQVRITTKENEQRIVNARNIPLPEEGLMVSTVIDMTHFYRNRAHLQIAIEAAELGTWVLDMQTGKTELNEEWSRMLGYERDEVNGDYVSFRSLLHPDDLKRLDMADRAIRDGQREFSMELRLRTKDGSYKWILDQGKVTQLDHRGRPIQLAGIHLDISKRKNLEDELSNFFQLSQDLLCIASMDGTFVKVNPAFSSLLGYSESELSGREIMDFVHPDDQEPTKAEFEHLGKGEPTVNFENRYIDREGKVHWLSWSSSEATEAGLVYAVAKVITMRKEIESELHESMNRLSAAHELAKLGYWQIDFVKDELDWNEGMFDLWGADLAEFEGNVELMYNMIHPDDRKIKTGLRAEDFEDEEALMTQFRVITLSGDIRWIMQRVRPEMKDGSVVGAKGVCQDVTERVLFLEELQAQNKRLREIAWTQSHQVRAPLAKIMSLVELIKAEGLKAKESAEYLEKLIASSHELDKVIRDISHLANADSSFETN